MYLQVHKPLKAAFQKITLLLQKSVLCFLFLICVNMIYMKLH